MSYINSLSTSQWVMFVIQTMGSIDLPGRGPRKLPAPKQYVAIVVAWIGLDIFADAGYAKAAATVGWILVLTSLVVGPFGKQLTTFLTDIGQLYPTSSTTSTDSTASDQSPIINRTMSA